MSCPHIELAVVGGAVKGPTITTVAVAYHDVRAGPDDALLYAREPEVLQCVIEDGKIATIYWKTLGKPKNPDGLVRFVKKRCKRD